VRRAPGNDHQVVSSLDFLWCLSTWPWIREKTGRVRRVVTDKATFAYLADVFILADHRGQGLSKRLLEVVLAHPQLQGLRRWLLFTADAHQLYEQFGFVPTAYPERIMEIRWPYVGDQ
jgi:GNAT superfamily N-acetyltransferase